MFPWRKLAACWAIWLCIKIEACRQEIFMGFDWNPLVVLASQIRGGASLMFGAWDYFFLTSGCQKSRVKLKLTENLPTRVWCKCGRPCAVILSWLYLLQSATIVSSWHRPSTSCLRQQASSSSKGKGAGQQGQRGDRKLSTLGWSGTKTDFQVFVFFFSLQKYNRK